MPDCNFGYLGETYDFDENGEPYYTDLNTNNPDGLSDQDALRQYGVQSVLPLCQDARYERAQVTDEVNKTRDLYEQENHIGLAFPPLAFTDDEQDVIRAKYTAPPMWMRPSMLADVLAVYQAANNRYMGL